MPLTSSPAAMRGPTISPAACAAKTSETIMPREERPAYSLMMAELPG